MSAMAVSDLPLDRIARGKVRDVYAVDDDRLLLLTTDRISAFDVVMTETIPHKGAVLTQITAWWLRQLDGRIAHHLISVDTDEIHLCVAAATTAAQQVALVAAADLGFDVGYLVQR